MTSDTQPWQDTLVPSFSILIPTWNNLPYLQKCIESLRAHSIAEHQILVFVNEGRDGTLEWLRQQRNIQYEHAPTNIGIARAVNILSAMATQGFLVYFNDDMYALPGWDLALARWIWAFPNDRFVLSATMIEPRPTGNPAVVVADFGQDLVSFREKELLARYRTLIRPHWQGAMWPPVLLPRRLWFEIGGFSVEYESGFYTDPDLMRKAYLAGVRYFIGVGDALVYHFMQKSTRRIASSRVGYRTYRRKWQEKPSFFKKQRLQLGQPLADIPAFHLIFGDQ